MSAISQKLIQEIKKLSEKVEELNETSSPETITECLLEISSLTPQLEYLSRTLQDQFSSVLRATTTKLISLGRITNTGSVIAPSIDPTLVEIEGEPIGEGNFGTVFQGKLAEVPVAVKKIKGLNGKTRKTLLKEARLMDKIRCPNVVRFMGTSVYNDEIWIITELCDADLYDVCRYNRGDNQTAFLRNAVRWFGQAARGLTWMHEVCSMVHGDVKPANILLRNGDALIADFGFTRFIKAKDHMLLGARGSPYYVAPEILCGKEYGFPVDVYAFAISMYEILLGANPYGSSIPNEEQLYESVKRNIRPDLSVLAEKLCPASLLVLIEQCWNADPTQRPKMRDVFNALKAIFIETFVPRSSRTFDFWLTSFGNEIIDQVSYPRFRSVLPSGHIRKIESMRCNLLGIPLPSSFGYHINLQDVYNWECWYGDWIDLQQLEKLVAYFGEYKWFVHDMNKITSESNLRKQYEQTKRSCFLLRCSKTNPANFPFTITICSDGQCSNHRVAKNVEGKFSCLSLGVDGSPVIQMNDVLGLVQALLHNHSLEGDYYDPDKFLKEDGY